MTAMHNVDFKRLANFALANIANAIPADERAKCEQDIVTLDLALTMLFNHQKALSAIGNTIFHAGVEQDHLLTRATERS